MTDDALPNPPRNGEGNRAKSGGGGSRRAVKPTTDTARRLRREMSLPEALLWNQLRRQQLGVKFRKGHPIGPYVADFYCSAHRLVVEVDGEVHERGDQPARDAERDRFMIENGYAIVRYAARDVLGNLEGVLTAITSRVESPLHRPSDGPPLAGEE